MDREDLEPVCWMLEGLPIEELILSGEARAELLGNGRDSASPALAKEYVMEEPRTSISEMPADLYSINLGHPASCHPVRSRIGGRATS